ncbi:hypothetical protein [Micromonospora sp. NPDC049799]
MTDASTPVSDRPDRRRPAEGGGVSELAERTVKHSSRADRAVVERSEATA